MDFDANYSAPGQFPAQACALCGTIEARAGGPSALESMGWQQINGWVCPVCGGREAMAAKFWNPVHWHKPEVDENGEFRL